MMRREDSKSAATTGAKEENEVLLPCPAHWDLLPNELLRHLIEASPVKQLATLLLLDKRTNSLGLDRRRVLAALLLPPFAWTRKEILGGSAMDCVILHRSGSNGSTDYTRRNPMWPPDDDMDMHTTTLATAIKAGALGSCEELYICGAAVGGIGFSALADALCIGARNINRFIVPDNRMGDIGASALARAIERGALPQLVYLFIGNNNMFTLS